MKRSLASWAVTMFFALAATAAASTGEEGWVVLQYMAGDNNLDYYLDADISELASVGSGKYNGRYATFLALQDRSGIGDSKYWWLFKSNTDLDGQGSSTHNGRVNMDRVLYWNDGTAAGCDLYKDEIFLDLNANGTYQKAVDVCVWDGQTAGVQAPEGVAFAVADLNTLVGADIGGGDVDVTEVDTGDPATMGNFFQNSKNVFTNYWNYGIIFQNNHGGFQLGSWDDHNAAGAISHSMNAIQEDTVVHEASIKQLHVLFYDQCLRSGMDPYFENVDNADNGCPFYSVASELTVGGYGMDYALVGNYFLINPSADPEDAAIEMVNAAKSSYGGLSYDTCAAVTLNRVSSFGTGADVKDVAADIDALGAELNNKRTVVAPKIIAALNETYDYGNLAYYFTGFDLKRFVEALKGKVAGDASLSMLTLRLQTVSDDLTPDVTRMCVANHAPSGGTLYGISTFSPLINIMQYADPSQDPRNNENAGGYWRWVDNGWSVGTQPLFYYKSAPGAGQTADQLSDYAKIVPQWATFLKSDLNPPYVKSFTPATGAVNVSPSTSIIGDFPEAINLSYGTVTVTANGQAVSGSLQRLNLTIGGIQYGRFVFTPSSALPCNARIQVTVNNDFRDLSGLRLDITRGTGGFFNTGVI